MSNNISALLVGTGNMGREYGKVLNELCLQYFAVCRSERSAKEYESETGVKTYSGGITNLIKYVDKLPNRAIIAVSIDQLMDTVINLIQCNVKKILVEKPAGLNKDQIKKIADCAKIYDAEVYVAYNRRFYSSTQKAMQIIDHDGGVSSFDFEFTEWGWKIEGLNHSPAVKKEWLLANSSHVIDLAFFLGGNPVKMSCYNAGSLSWHNRASKYTGAGITDKGALFSYHANWDAPGRWSVEILTNDHRLYFKPMEKLSIQNKGSVSIEDVVIDDRFDKMFKPGLYKQTEAFFKDEKDDRFLRVEDQLRHMDFYEQIETNV